MDDIENISLPTSEPLSFLDDPEQLRFNKMFSDPDTLGGLWGGSFDDMAELTLEPQEIKTGAANLQWLAYQERMPLEEMSEVKDIYQPEYGRRIFESEDSEELGFFHSVQQRLLDQEQARQSYNLYLAGVAGNILWPEANTRLPSISEWHSANPEAARWIEPDRIGRDTAVLQAGLQRDFAGQEGLLRELTHYWRSEGSGWTEERKSSLQNGIAVLPPDKQRSVVEWGRIIASHNQPKGAQPYFWPSFQSSGAATGQALPAIPSFEAPKQSRGDAVEKASSLAKDFEPELGFWNKALIRWSRGEREGKRNEYAYRAATGEVAWEPRKEDPEAENAEGDGWLEQGALGAAEMLPGMLNGITAGMKTGAAFAGTAGLAALVGGQAGPQAALPEEAITVPGGMLLGWEVGQVYGSSTYWYGQGVGSMYDTLRAEGIPHNVASPISQTLGAPFALIEFVQVSKLAPGLKRQVAQAVSRKIAERLAQLAKEKGIDYLEVVSQEVMQELVNIAGEAMAESIAGVEAPDDKRTAWERVKGTLVQSLKVFPFLMGPKTVHDTIHIVLDTEALPPQTDGAPATEETFDPEKPNKSEGEPGLLFSKTNKPHELAAPIGLNYKTDDERLTDPAIVLEEAIRRSGGTSEGKQGKHGRQLASGPSLYAWAHEHGREFDPGLFQKPDFAGGEHIVFRDKKTGRFVKLTKPGLFGAQAEDAGAYLERWALSNRVFGDDVKFEGVVTLPGEHAPRAVISQPDVPGRDATPEEQRDYLKSKGFVEHEHRWVHPVLGVAVWDTITPGNVITRPDGTMQAVDLQVEPARPEELRAVRQATGLGGETVFSKGEAGGTSDASPEHAQNVREWTGSLLKDWGSRLDVTVHNSAEAILDGALRSKVQAEDGDIEAFFNPKDGKIHLLADRVGSKADAERLLRHEGIHWAIRGPLSKEYASILDGVRKRIDPQEWDSLSKSYKGATDNVRTEEYLAYLGQTNPQSSVWRSFVYETKQFLNRAFGKNFEVTDGDILAFLQKANRKLEKGEGTLSGARVGNLSDIGGESAENQQLLFSKLKQRDELRAALASGEFKEVNFGKLGKRQTDEINRIRTDNGRSLLRDGDFVLPAHIVKHLYESRIVKDGMTPSDVADAVHSVLTNSKVRAKQGRGVDFAEIVRTREKLSQVGVIGKDRAGNDVLITTIPKLTRRAWK